MKESRRMVEGQGKTSPLPSVFKKQDNDGIGREGGSAGADFNACPQFSISENSLFFNITNFSLSQFFFLLF